MTLMQADEVARPGQEFFDRARARLTLDVPAALSDLSAPARRGDLDLDPATWERAGVKATRKAAVIFKALGGGWSEAERLTSAQLADDDAARLRTIVDVGRRGH